jgi:hypothetical protein
MRRLPQGFEHAKKLLTREKNDLALLVGNGINLASADEPNLSWDKLMGDLISAAEINAENPEATRANLRRLLKRGKDGLTPATLPEVFDIVDAHGSTKAEGKSNRPGQSLQELIVRILGAMRPGSNHRAVVKWATTFGVPILTTNYDHCLEDTIGFKQYRFGGGRPKSDYYPWDRYYAEDKVADPACEFAIWHIHGDRDLKRSIRVGLDQYMGMAQRLRKLKHPIAKETLVNPQSDVESLPAFHAAPWLRVFLGRKLWIHGLGLRAAEVSLRWLLIERFRYWKRYRPDLVGPTGWYVHGPVSAVGKLDRQRRIFLESVGLQVVEIQRTSFAGLYQ